MNRSLDSVLDSLLSEMNWLNEYSLDSSNLVSVLNNSSGESGGEVLSTQYLLGAEVARYYNNLASGSLSSRESHIKVPGLHNVGELAALRP